MKLIKIHPSFFLKETRRDLDREGDNLFVTLSAVHIEGVPYSRNDRLSSYHFNLQIQKKGNEFVWSFLKDINQEKMAIMIFNSLKKHSKDLLDFEEIEDQVEKEERIREYLGEAYDYPLEISLREEEFPFFMSFPLLSELMLENRINFDDLELVEV